jgi:hypothetical protein
MTTNMSTYKELDILAQVTKQAGYLSPVEKRDVLKFYEINECGLNQLVNMVKFNRDMNKQTIVVINLYKRLTISRQNSA